MSLSQCATPTTTDSGHEESIPTRGDSIRLRIWYGSVPVVIHHGEESLSLDVPRLSYFPIAFDALRRHFRLLPNATIRLSSLVGESVDGQGRQGGELRTHLPVGLLYDLLADRRLPWHVSLLLLPTVSSSSPIPAAFVESTHTTEWTEGGSTRDRDALRSCIWNSLKQSAYLRYYPSIRRVQDLTPAESEGLLKAMMTLDFLSHARLGKSLFSITTTTSSHGIRFIPMRGYLHRPTNSITTTTTTTTTSNDDDRDEKEGYVPIAVQDLITPRTEGRATTMRDVMVRVLPHLATLGPQIVDVVVHGVTVAWGTSVVELLEEASYVDGWLYFVVKLSVALKARLEEQQDREKEEEAEKEVQTRRTAQVLAETFKHLAS